MSDPVFRHAGRVLLLDGDDRLLMINEREYGGTDDYWLTPGGGVEAGETVAQAAVRELYEETGIVVVLDPATLPVFTDRRVWSLGDVTYDQVNEFFAARVASGTEPVPHSLTGLEQQTLIGMRWWTVGELRASSERFYPAGVADLASDMVADLRADVARRGISAS